LAATLSYDGSKSRLARDIIAAFPDHHCYVEACAGSAAVMMRKPASPIEVLNDRDHLLVNFYDVLRTRPDELQRVLRYTPYGRALHGWLPE
jgi:DNA adenine methylase